MIGEREIVKDLRASLRVKEHIPVRWSVKDTALNGRGRILNISTSGAMLETSNVAAAERAIFSLETIKSNGFILPREGRLVWSRPKGWGNNRQLCGLEFVEPNEESVAQLREKVQKGIVKGASARRWKSVTGIILSVIMLVLTAFSVRQYTENYENTLLAYQLLSGTYEKQSSLTETYARELSTTKGLLFQAQTDLELAKAEIGELTARTDQLTESNNNYQAMISQLEEKNAQLAKDMQALQERLSYLDGNVKDLAEAKNLIGEYKDKFRLVKGKIRAFNRQAFEAKVAAQKEKDRIAMLLGNNGYLVKDGKSHVPDPALAEKQRIQIDVEIVK